MVTCSSVSCHSRQVKVERVDLVGFLNNKEISRETLDFRYRTVTNAVRQQQHAVASSVASHLQSARAGTGGAAVAILSSRPENPVKLGILKAGFQPVHVGTVDRGARPYLTSERDISRVAAKLKNLDAHVVFVGTKRDFRTALEVAARARSNPGMYPTIDSIMMGHRFRMPKRLKHMRGVVVPLTVLTPAQPYNPEKFAACTTGMPRGGRLIRAEQKAGRAEQAPRIAGQQSRGGESPRASSFEREQPVFRRGNTLVIRRPVEEGGPVRRNTVLEGTKEHAGRRGPGRSKGDSRQAVPAKSFASRIQVEPVSERHYHEPLAAASEKNSFASFDTSFQLRWYAGFLTREDQTKGQDASPFCEQYSSNHLAQRRQQAA